MTFAYLLWTMAHYRCISHGTFLKAVRSKQALFAVGLLLFLIPFRAHRMNIYQPETSTFWPPYILNVGFFDHRNVWILSDRLLSLRLVLGNNLMLDISPPRMYMPFRDGTAKALLYFCTKPRSLRNRELGGFPRLGARLPTNSVLIAHLWPQLLSPQGNYRRASTRRTQPL